MDSKWEVNDAPKDRAALFTMEFMLGKQGEKKVCRATDGRLSYIDSKFLDLLIAERLVGRLRSSGLKDVA